MTCNNSGDFIKSGSFWGQVTHPAPEMSPIQEERENGGATISFFEGIEDLLTEYEAPRSLTREEQKRRKLEADRRIKARKRNKK